MMAESTVDFLSSKRECESGSVAWHPMATAGRDRARRAAWRCLVLTALTACGCPMNMNPPNGNNNDNDNGNGLMCETGAAIGAPTVSYANDIFPLLQDSGCLSAGCHGGSLPSSGYSLATYESTFEAGDEAEAFGNCPIVPGDAQGSYFVEKLLPNPRTGARMPFLGVPLTDGQIQMISQWIDQGAANN